MVTLPFPIPKTTRPHLARVAMDHAVMSVQLEAMVPEELREIKVQKVPMELKVLQDIEEMLVRAVPNQTHGPEAHQVLRVNLVHPVNQVRDRSISLHEIT